MLRSGLNGSDRGYVAGGYTGSYVATVTKLVFATDTMSANLGTSLSVGRAYPAGVSNGTYCYAVGGNTGALSGVADSITFSTDTVAVDGSGSISAEIYTSLSYPADNGYLAVRNSTNTYSKKIVLSTGVSANVTNTPTALEYLSFGVSDGNGLGWLAGDSTSPYSETQKFTKATETYAADATAVMVAGKYEGAYFNNGAY